MKLENPEVSSNYTFKAPWRERRGEMGKSTAFTQGAVGPVEQCRIDPGWSYANMDDLFGAN